MKTIQFVFIFFIASTCISFFSTNSLGARLAPSVDTTMNSADCIKIVAVRQIIGEAIDIGAPTYNDGNHAACYRIYEGAAYKILYEHGSKCRQVSKVLKSALEKSYKSLTSTERAWIMRVAFDQILGVETRVK